MLQHAGADDPRCPLAGLEIPKTGAIKVYEDANCPENFKVSTAHCRRNM